MTQAPLRPDCQRTGQHNAHSIAYTRIMASCTAFTSGRRTLRFRLALPAPQVSTASS